MATWQGSQGPKDPCCDGLLLPSNNNRLNKLAIQLCSFMCASAKWMAGFLDRDI